MMLHDVVEDFAFCIFRDDPGPAAGSTVLNKFKQTELERLTKKTFKKYISGISAYRKTNRTFTKT